MASSSSRPPMDVAAVLKTFSSLGLIYKVPLSAAVAVILFKLYRAMKSAGARSRNEPPIDHGLPILGKTSAISGDPFEFTKGHKGLWQTSIFGLINTIVVSGCENSEKVYRREKTGSTEAYVPDHVAGVLGANAVLCATGDFHKKLRGALLSCFQPRVLLTTSEPIQDISNNALRSWIEGGGVFDGGHEPAKIAFAVGTSFVGMDTAKMPKEKVEEIMEMTVVIAEGFVSMPWDLGRWSAYGRSKIEAKRLRGMMMDIVNTRRDLLRELKAAGKPEPDDVLQRFVNLKEEDGTPMSDAVIMENMGLMIFASFETTAATLAAFFVSICRYPEIQEKAHQHIIDVLGEDSDEFLGKKHIARETWAEFGYIEQLISEVERTIPPVVNTSWRKATQDFKLDGYNISKDKLFLINSTDRTRDPVYWTRPDSFEPERFGPGRMEHKKGPGKGYKLNTFGGGTRKCLGSGLADLERKIFAVCALRDYKFSFADDRRPNVQYDLAMRIKGAFPVRIERRSHVRA